MKTQLPLIRLCNLYGDRSERLLLVYYDKDYRYSYLRKDGKLCNYHSSNFNDLTYETIHEAISYLYEYFDCEFIIDDDPDRYARSHGLVHNEKILTLIFHKLSQNETKFSNNH